MKESSVGEYKGEQSFGGFYIKENTTQTKR